jgi:Zn-dependent peptidase ImmA (M78 family)
MCGLARAKRAEHHVETAALDLRTMQRVYKAEEIRIDNWDIKGHKIRAAYFCDDGDCSVLLNKNLPREPKLFSLAHELKHHFTDRKSIEGGQIRCGDYNANEVIEIAAEVFAAEFIYPELEMRALATQQGIAVGQCTAEAVVRFKHVCPAPVSYTFLVKRFERFGLCTIGQFKGVQFQKLEEQLYGVPFYKTEWFKRHRARKRGPVLGN